MATESVISLRRFAGFGFILLLVVSLIAAAAAQQVPAPPFVVTSAGVSPAHTFNASPSIKGCAVAPTGDVVCLDVNNNHAWHFPVDGRPVQDVGWISSEHSWKNNFGPAIDSKMTLYVGANYAINGIWRVPYDPVAKTWKITGSDSQKFACAGSNDPYCPGGIPTGSGWYQPTAIAVDKNDNLVVATTNGTPAFMIFTLVVNPDGTPGASQIVVNNMKARADWVAVDQSGNIFFAEEGFGGVYMLPAGQTVSGDGKGSLEVGPDGLPTPPLVRVDMLASDSPAVPDAENPAKFLFSNNLQGVAVDATGNLYYGQGDTSSTPAAAFNNPNLKGGIWMVPNEDGTLNPKHTVLIVPVNTPGALAIDNRTGALWAAVPGSWNGLTDVAKFTIGRAALGAAAVGDQGSTVTVFHAFNHDDTITDEPLLVFNLLPSASGNADFSQVGGDCAAQVYHQFDRCTVTLALTPHTVGPVEGALAVQQKVQVVPDSDVFEYPNAATTTLQGIGQGGEVAFLKNPYEWAVGTGLTGAGQVTVDAAGDVYVAASGQKSVLVYPPDAGASTEPVQLGKDLLAPTGVAVDGLKNVFIADSGNLIEVPFENGAWNQAGQVVLKTGLGTSVTLAASPSGFLYVSDPDNQQVLRIRIVYPPSQQSPLNPGTGVGVITQAERAFAFATLSGIGLDSAGNLLVSDGTNVIGVDEYDQQLTIATGIGAASSLSMDPSGALYYSSASGAFRVPQVNGSLAVDEQMPLAAGVTAPRGLALAPTGNVYLVDSVAENLHVVSVHGIANFGTIELGDHPALESEVFNIGNSAITFTDFASTNPLDFTAVGSAINGCDAITPTPLAAGNSCFLTTTFDPGNGEEGVLTGQISLNGDAKNAPVMLNVGGVGAALAASKTSIVVAGNASANDASVTVTVVAAEGSQVPTGKVTVMIDGAAVATDYLGSDGTASFDLKPVKAGSHVYSAAYNGDRVFGRSMGSSTVNIAKGGTTIEQPALTPNASDPSAAFLPYVLGNTQNGDAYTYKFRVKVKASAGVPTGHMVLMQGNTVIQDTKVDASGMAEFSSAGFANNPDSTVLHPYTTYTVKPVYVGDDNYTQSSGTEVTFHVLRFPSVLITSAPASVAVAAGSTASANLTLTSMVGYGDLDSFTGAVELQCDNLPAYVTCSFYPSRVTVNGSTIGHTVLTVNTNVPVGAIAHNNATPTIWLFASVFGFGAVGLMFGRKTRYDGRWLTTICAALVITGAVAGITACGTSSGANPNPAAITPKGSYNITVTARQIGGDYVVGQQGAQQVWVSLPMSVKLDVN